MSLYNVFDIAQSDGTTVLHLSAYFGFTDIVSLLRFQRYDDDILINVKDTEVSSTPLSPHALCFLLYYVKIIILSLCVYVVSSTQRGNTALHYAIIQDHPNMVLLLLEHGAKANIQNNIMYYYSTNITVA